MAWYSPFVVHVAFTTLPRTISCGFRYCIFCCGFTEPVSNNRSSRYKCCTNQTPTYMLENVELNTRQWILDGLIAIFTNFHKPLYNISNWPSGILEFFLFVLLPLNPQTPSSAFHSLICFPHLPRHHTHPYRRLFTYLILLSTLHPLLLLVCSERV